jgi:hypothetical protein
MLFRPAMAATVLLLQVSAFSPVLSQSQSQAFLPTHSTTASAAGSGLLTSRLSGKEMERWKKIERLVFAEGANHQPLHPTLRGMWEWIETSGHIVHVEIVRSTRLATCTAGNFSIEHFDPKGERHVGVIKLYLGNIDQAFVGESVARENGFIPFEGLEKYERYAEVLGHELAHAVDILTSPASASAVEVKVEKTNEMLLRAIPKRKGDTVSPELKTRLTERDRLLQGLEKRAEHMEWIVWRELTASQLIREKAQSLTANR